MFSQGKSLWGYAAVIHHGNQISAAKRKAAVGSTLRWDFSCGEVEVNFYRLLVEKSETEVCT